MFGFIAVATVAALSGKSMTVKPRVSEPDWLAFKAVADRWTRRHQISS